MMRNIYVGKIDEMFCRRTDIPATWNFPYTSHQNLLQFNGSAGTYVPCETLKSIKMFNSPQWKWISCMDIFTRYWTRQFYYYYCCWLMSQTLVDILPAIEWSSKLVSSILDKVFRFIWYFGVYNNNLLEWSVISIIQYTYIYICMYSCKNISGRGTGSSNVTSTVSTTIGYTLST